MARSGNEIPEGALLQVLANKKPGITAGFFVGCAD
jgi:hypothetical protein